MEEEIKSLLWQGLHILVNVQGTKDSLFHEEDGGGVLRVDPVLLHGLSLSNDGLLSQELGRLEAILVGILLSGLPKQRLFGAEVGALRGALAVLFLRLIEDLEDLPVLG